MDLPPVWLKPQHFIPRSHGISQGRAPKARTVLTWMTFLALGFRYTLPPRVTRQPKHVQPTMWERRGLPLVEDRCRPVCLCLLRLFTFEKGSTLLGGYNSHDAHFQITSRLRPTWRWCNTKFTAMATLASSVLPPTTTQKSQLQKLPLHYSQSMSNLFEVQATITVPHTWAINHTNLETHWRSSTRLLKPSASTTTWSTLHRMHVNKPWTPNFKCLAEKLGQFDKRQAQVVKPSISTHKFFKIQQLP